MEWVIGWFGFALVVGVLAGHRGRNGAGWFFLSLAISPLLAGVLLMALPKQENLAGGLRKCPACAELVKSEAKVCRYCHRDLPPLPAAAEQPIEASRKAPEPATPPATTKRPAPISAPDPAPEAKQQAPIPAADPAPASGPGIWIGAAVLAILSAIVIYLLLPA